MTAEAREGQIVISRNHPVFDLPEIVAIEHGLFAGAGLDVRLAQTAPAQERESRDPIARRKEALFESERADLFNLCEWGGIDRLERNQRGGYIGYLRPAVVAQGLVSFDPTLNEPHDVSGVPVGVNEFTGSHYTALHLLEGTVPRDRIVLEHVGPPFARLDAVAAGSIRAVMLMEPYLSLALERGAHLLGCYFYRGAQVVAPHLPAERLDVYVSVVNDAVDIINADRTAWAAHIVSEVEGSLAPERLRSEYHRFTHATPFTRERFTESYAWMNSWQLTDGRSGYDTLLALR
ncbi:nitrate ABC transporter substrate-binding protein [Streptomyces shenzhenensis]|uniref:Nitrate ABC transporter substrate-binding protein n=1 Tax=Streptomyces shenzhenensis TaxID=943815 RepID=A0A3M0HWI7_9ACTN|nr:nitrate ABC transporter substrate-binding protein [Streptomyces shenzhenensis]RMB81397.1 nitrate ABC transporter substrate-binding protein [Streptomyces shenzhenensis]